MQKDIINLSVDKMPTSAKNIEGLIVAILRVQVEKYRKFGLPNKISSMPNENDNFSEDKIQIIIE